MCDNALCYINRRWRGTTLLELMITLTLSLLLLGLLSVIYVAMEQQNDLQAALITLHNNSRFVLQTLGAELQAAGFLGCPRWTAAFPLSNTTRYSLDPGNKVELHQDASGSTVVTVRHRSVQAARLRTPMMQSTVLQWSATWPVAPDDILLVADCNHADLFQVATVTKHPGWQTVTAREPLRYHYLENAEVSPFEINTYAVEQTSRKDDRGQVISALYRTDLYGHKAELVEGIQSMRLDVFQLSDASRRGIAMTLQVHQGLQAKTEYGFVVLRN